MKTTVKNLCKGAVEDIMMWCGMDTTDFIQLAVFEERACIIFGILIGISAILFGLFNMVAVPVGIVTYGILNTLTVNVGVSVLSQEAYEKVINEIEEDIKEMKSKLF